MGEGTPETDRPELILKWVAPQKWIVQKPYYEVPPGFVTDLSSVPKPLRGYLSKGDVAPAAVRHDWAYSVGVNRQLADERFYKRCRKLGLRRSKAAAIYYALRLFGWRHHA